MHKDWAFRMSLIAMLAGGTATYKGFKYDQLFRLNNECDDAGNGKHDPRRDPLSSEEDPFFRSRQHRSLKDDIQLTTEDKAKAENKFQHIVVLTGNSNQQLASEVVEKLGTSLTKATVGNFADGETFVRIDDTVRGKDVFIIQSTCPPVNQNLMELLLMVST